MFFFSLNLSVILHPLVFPRKWSVLLFLWARNIDLLSIIQHSNRQSWSTPFFFVSCFHALSRSLSLSLSLYDDSADIPLMMVNMAMGSRALLSPIEGESLFSVCSLLRPVQTICFYSTAVTVINLFHCTLSLRSATYCQSHPLCPSVIIISIAFTCALSSCFLLIIVSCLHKKETPLS